MASMQEIRTRINSVKDTMKITNAMYLISSSKLRKARSGHDSVSPYFATLKSTIWDIINRTSGAAIEGGLFEDRGEEKVNRCFIVISSDKGLAGAYNHNVFKMVEQKLAEKDDNTADQSTIILVGHMGIPYFRKINGAVIDEEHIYPAADPVMYRAWEISENVIHRFLEKEFDEVYIAYTEMVNSLVFEPKIIRILPLMKAMFEDAAPLEGDLREPEFSPSPEEVLRHIVPNYVKGIIYGAMVESYACEQSARMTAMDNATTNAREMIDELSLIYNRVRQAAITQEITEIVSGAQSAH
jgi:F-type H+-transporting ATPase subunit gamma